MPKPKPPTRAQFDARFPDDDACLDHLMITRYGRKFACPKCEKVGTFYRIKARRAYECEWCAHQIYPTAGTPFHATRTSLKDWFFVMFLFCTSRNGVSAKEVQRTLGVTYKTAWRMCRLIRAYMGYVDGDHPVGGAGGGAVEADKTFIGGKDKKGQDDKAVVLGMVERGGDVVTRVIPSRSRRSVEPVMESFIKPGSRVYTDSAEAFSGLSEEHRHEMVNHSAKEWVRGDVHTNSIEGFWANVKRGINGTYVWVSKKHLPTYLGEFEFRHNMRHAPHQMLDTLLLAFPRG